MANGECQFVPVEQFLGAFLVVQRVRSWIGEDGPGSSAGFDMHVNAALEQGLQVEAPIGALAIDQADRDEEFVLPRLVRPGKDLDPHVKTRTPPDLLPDLVRPGVGVRG